MGWTRKGPLFGEVRMNEIGASVNTARLNHVHHVAVWLCRLSVDITRPFFIFDGDFTSMSGKNTHKRLLCSVCRNRRCRDGHCWLVSTLLQTRLPQGTLHCFCMRNLVLDWTVHGYWGNTSTCFSLVPSQEICALLRLLVAFVRTHPNLGVPVVQIHKF